MKKLTFNLIRTFRHPRFGSLFPDGYEASGVYDVWESGKQVMDSDGTPLHIEVMGINHRNGKVVMDSEILTDLAGKAKMEMDAIEKKKLPEVEREYTKTHEVDLDATGPGRIVP